MGAIPRAGPRSPQDRDGAAGDRRPAQYLSRRRNEAGEVQVCRSRSRRGGLIVRDPRSTLALTMNDQTPFIGRSMTRREDRRLLTGRGQYIADLELPLMLHVVFVRSPQAHARIKAIDVSRAAAAPGVAHVLTGPELARVL